MNNTGYKSTGYKSTGDYSTGDYSTGDGSTGNGSTGNKSTGHRSTGYKSTGYKSTGDYSTGDYSTGDYSTGDGSIGDGSTGNRSTGYGSTGNRSTGHYSTGNGSTGNRSTGHYSTGDRSTGHFCTEDGEYRMFNKPCTKEEFYCNKPNWLRFALTEWIDIENMTEEEKNNNPSCNITGGYLKVYNYKEAALKSWNNASEDEKEQTRNLPNFDDSIFKEIFGFSAYENEEEIKLKVKKGKKFKIVYED